MRPSRAGSTTHGGLELIPRLGEISAGARPPAPRTRCRIGEPAYGFDHNDIVHLIVETDFASGCELSGGDVVHLVVEIVAGVTSWLEPQ